MTSDLSLSLSLSIPGAMRTGFAAPYTALAPVAFMVNDTHFGVHGGVIPPSDVLWDIVYVDASLTPATFPPTPPPTTTPPTSDYEYIGRVQHVMAKVTGTDGVQYCMIAWGQDGM